MQKKLLLLFMIMNCSMIYAGDYTDELIAQYNEAMKTGSIDGVYSNQKAVNERRRTEERSCQCNGRHFSQPDENSITGRRHAEIEAEYNNNSQINDELFEGYKNNFDFDEEIKAKTFLMAEIYLRGLDKCGKDNSCLHRNSCFKWEEISALGFVEEQSSTVYDPALYRDRVVLTKEQKLELTQNDPKIKELAAKLNEKKQKLQDKINSLK